jgi:hypothetical protein
MPLAMRGQILYELLLPYFRKIDIFDENAAKFNLFLASFWRKETFMSREVILRNGFIHHNMFIIVRVCAVCVFTFCLVRFSTNLVDILLSRGEVSLCWSAIENWGFRIFKYQGSIHIFVSFVAAVCWDGGRVVGGVGLSGYVGLEECCPYWADRCRAVFCGQ